MFITAGPQNTIATIKDQPEVSVAHRINLFVFHSVKRTLTVCKRITFGF
jgi:hypothetical protein